MSESPEPPSPAILETESRFGLWRYCVRNYRILCELQEFRMTVPGIAFGTLQHTRDPLKALDTFRLIGDILVERCCYVEDRIGNTAHPAGSLVMTAFG